MSRFFFSDNTVLVSFAHVDRLQFLETLLRGKGRWCATVAQECAASASFAGMESLRDAPRIFGEPERPNSAELVDARVLRDRMAAPGDHRHAHLGEAETVAIMSRRYPDSYFITDDVGAKTIAAAEGLQVLTTWDLLRLLGHAGLVTPEDLWADLETLRAAGRGRPPGVTNRSTFSAWLGL